MDVRTSWCTRICNVSEWFDQPARPVLIMAFYHVTFLLSFTCDYFQLEVVESRGNNLQQTVQWQVAVIIQAYTTPSSVNSPTLLLLLP